MSMTFCNLCSFPKDFKRLNIVLRITLTVKLDNSKLEEGFSKILEDWKTAVPNFGIFEKLEEIKWMKPRSLNARIWHEYVLTLLLARARMTLLRFERELLMAMVSFIRTPSEPEDLSLSDPARSTRLRLPTHDSLVLLFCPWIFRMNTEWDLKIRIYAWS